MYKPLLAFTLCLTLGVAFAEDDIAPYQLRGTIKDWPTGQEANLVIMALNGNPYWTGTIHKNGLFSLYLRTLLLPKDGLATAEESWPEPLLKENNCTSTIHTVPENVHFGFFNTLVTQNGQRVGDINLTDHINPYRTGTRLAQLIYAKQAVKLQGAITCPGTVTEYNLSLPKGWSLKVQEVVGKTSEGQYKWAMKDGQTSDLVWLLDQEWGGIGVQFEAQPPKGMKLTKVTPGSPADQAGLKVGDLLVSIDGLDVHSVNYDAASMALKGDPETMVAVGYVRDGAEKVVSIQRVLLKVR